MVRTPLVSPDDFITADDGTTYLLDHSGTKFLVTDVPTVPTTDRRAFPERNRKAIGVLIFHPRAVAWSD